MRRPALDTGQPVSRLCAQKQVPRLRAGVCICTVDPGPGHAYSGRARTCVHNPRPHIHMQHIHAAHKYTRHTEGDHRVVEGDGQLVGGARSEVAAQAEAHLLAGYREPAIRLRVALHRRMCVAQGCPWCSRWGASPHDPRGTPGSPCRRARAWRAARRSGSPPAPWPQRGTPASAPAAVRHCVLRPCPAAAAGGTHHAVLVLLIVKPCGVLLVPVHGARCGSGSVGWQQSHEPAPGYPWPARCQCGLSPGQAKTAEL